MKSGYAVGGRHAYSGLDQDELAYSVHHKVLETTSQKHGYELSNALMIPQMTVATHLKRSEDELSLKPGCAAGDCHTLSGPVHRAPKSTNVGNYSTLSPLSAPSGVGVGDPPPPLQPLKPLNTLGVEPWLGAPPMERCEWCKGEHREQWHSSSMSVDELGDSAHTLRSATCPLCIFTMVVNEHSMFWHNTTFRG